MNIYIYQSVHIYLSIYLSPSFLPVFPLNYKPCHIPFSITSSSSSTPPLLLLLLLCFTFPRPLHISLISFFLFSFLLSHSYLHRSPLIAKPWHLYRSESSPALQIRPSVHIAFCSVCLSVCLSLALSLSLSLLLYFLLYFIYSFIYLPRNTLHRFQLRNDD